MAMCKIEIRNGVCFKGKVSRIVPNRNVFRA